MATVTELALFKRCVERPAVITNLRDLTLAKVRDPTDAEALSEEVLLQRKALKLFHSAWSGLTKYIRQVCRGKCRPVEFPHLGIFFPLLPDKSSPGKLTSKALSSL